MPRSLPPEVHLLVALSCDTVDLYARVRLVSRGFHKASLVALFKHVQRLFSTYDRLKFGATLATLRTEGHLVGGWDQFGSFLAKVLGNPNTRDPAFCISVLRSIEKHLRVYDDDGDVDILATETAWAEIFENLGFLPRRLAHVLDEVGCFTDGKEESSNFSVGRVLWQCAYLESPSGTRRLVIEAQQPQRPYPVAARLAEIALAECWSDILLFQTLSGEFTLDNAGRQMFHDNLQWMFNRIYLRRRASHTADEVQASMASILTMLHSQLNVSLGDLGRILAEAEDWDGVEWNIFWSLSFSESDKAEILREAMKHFELIDGACSPLLRLGGSAGARMILLASQHPAVVISAVFYHARNNNGRGAVGPLLAEVFGSRKAVSAAELLELEWPHWASSTRVAAVWKLFTALFPKECGCQPLENFEGKLIIRYQDLVKKQAFCARSILELLRMNFLSVEDIGTAWALIIMGANLAADHHKPVIEILATVAKSLRHGTQGTKQFISVTELARIMPIVWGCVMEKTNDAVDPLSPYSAGSMGVRAKIVALSVFFSGLALDNKVCGRVVTSFCQGTTGWVQLSTMLRLSGKTQDDVIEIAANMDVVLTGASMSEWIAGMKTVTNLPESPQAGTLVSWL